jgi:hypothetical protein
MHELLKTQTNQLNFYDNQNGQPKYSLPYSKKIFEPITKIKSKAHKLEPVIGKKQFKYKVEK